MPFLKGQRQLNYCFIFTFVLLLISIISIKFVQFIKSEVLTLMSNLIEKAKGHMLSRRSFLGVSAGAVAAITLPGCGLQKVDAEMAAGLTKEEGKWISAACWHNCGGRCLNKAYVVEGIVLKQKTDDTHPVSYTHLTLPTKRIV